jgi:hypothetical protein
VPWGVLYLRDSGFRCILLGFDPLVSRYSARSMLGAPSWTMDALWSSGSLLKKAKGLFGCQESLSYVPYSGVFAVIERAGSAPWKRG